MFKNVVLIFLLSTQLLYAASENYYTKEDRKEALILGLFCTGFATCAWIEYNRDHKSFTFIISGMITLVALGNFLKACDL